jgi:hypothetical protein
MVQVDGAYAHRFGERFALEVGGAFTQMSIGRDDDTLFGFGLLPYVRPRWTVGRFSAATAFSLLGGSGGEVGAIGGIADGQIGIGGDRWSVYTGVYGYGYGEGLGSTVAAVQGRVGGEVMFPTRRGRVGMALEIYGQADWLRATEDPATTTSRFIGGGLKLRFELPDHAAKRSESTRIATSR